MENNDYIHEANTLEKDIIELINKIEANLGKERWVSIARTDIEKGFMALRHGIISIRGEKNETGR